MDFYYRKKLFFWALALMTIGVFCGNEASKRSSIDRRPNGGILRLTLNEKQMHDVFFEAQFTPRGELFALDNLQLYNFHPGSSKYPRLLISVDYAESSLFKWQGLTFSLNSPAFTPSSGSRTYIFQGELIIAKADEKKVEGSFSGQLIHPTNGRTFSIYGEFIAPVRLNI
ncbi:MAG: hypothetical protein ONB24_00930 [candidate division KSB1 bacterium]|nr:hypothetical protein [candidate division KSB1 bacterium]